METLTKPLSGTEIIRKMPTVKKQTRREAKENYQNNPEIRAVVEKLKEINGRPTQR